MTASRDKDSPSADPCVQTRGADSIGSVGLDHPRRCSVAGTQGQTARGRLMSPSTEGSDDRTPVVILGSGRGSATQLSLPPPTDGQNAIIDTDLADFSVLSTGE